MAGIDLAPWPASRPPAPRRRVREGQASAQRRGGQRAKKTWAAFGSPSVGRQGGPGTPLSWFLIVDNVFGANPFRRAARQLELSPLGENLRLLDVAFDHIGLRGRQQRLGLLALAAERGGELAVGERVAVIAQNGLAQEDDGLVQHPGILARDQGL